MLATRSGGCVPTSSDTPRSIRCGAGGLGNGSNYLLVPPQRSFIATNDLELETWVNFQIAIFCEPLGECMSFLGICIAPKHKSDQAVLNLISFQRKMTVLSTLAASKAVEASRLAFDHHESGDYGEAFYWAFEALKAGNANVLNLFAKMYQNGQFMEKDETKATICYYRAVAMGNICAIYNLGWTFLDEDDELAFYWFLRAAKLGDDEAMNEVGLAYAHGVGTTRNDTRAEYWLKRAAKDGNPPAMYNLGCLYACREKPDYTQAAFWLRKAVEEGSENAGEALEDVIDILVGDLLGPENGKQCRCPHCAKRETETATVDLQDLQDLQDEQVCQDFQDQECAICLNPLLEDDACTPDNTCGHKFHEDCITCWVNKCIEKKQDVTCPLCRKLVSAS
jgi:hypothetical protein